PTHSFSWEALAYWAGTIPAMDAIFDAIRPSGIRLHDWLQNFSTGAGYRSALASAWMKQWGLDLQRLSKDRNARNLASYRPTTFSYAASATVREVFEDVRVLWVLCEPRGSSKFSTLDNWLLRYSLERSFQSAHARKRTAKQSKRMYVKYVQNM